MKYRKKPVVIDAMQYVNYYDYNNINEILEFMGDHAKGVRIHYKDGEQLPYLVIPTLEGDMYAKNEDYIIKGICGEFYPCKPDIFMKTYERVE